MWCSTCAVEVCSIRKKGASTANNAFQCIHYRELSDSRWLPPMHTFLGSCLHACALACCVLRFHDAHPVSPTIILSLSGRVFLAFSGEPLRGLPVLFFWPNRNSIIAVHSGAPSNHAKLANVFSMPSAETDLVPTCHSLAAISWY